MAPDRSQERKAPNQRHQRQSTCEAGLSPKIEDCCTVRKPKFKHSMGHHSIGDTARVDFPAAAVSLEEYQERLERNLR